MEKDPKAMNKSMSKKNIKNLAIIPARSGSKGVPKKNIKSFRGKPLIAHAIEQARQSRLFDRVLVDTDSPEIARIARRHGAETPFLRPAELAGDTAQVTDAVLLLLQRLKEQENYQPDIVTLLQTTSPLRETEDIRRCAQAMADPRVKSVCTVCETHHRLYHMASDNRLVLVNKPQHDDQNRQAWPQCYILNGCMVYMVRTDHFLRARKFVDENTRGVICDKWRSIDLDGPTDWVLAEVIHKNKKKVKQKVKFV